MRKLQDDSEAAFVQPAATRSPTARGPRRAGWRSRCPGDRGLYRNRVTLTKRGDELIFSNAGSAPQRGTLNAGAPGVEGRGRVDAQLDDAVRPDVRASRARCGTASSRSSRARSAARPRPAAVSGGTALTLLHSIGLGGLVISKMLASSTDEAAALGGPGCMGVLCFPINAISGLDQRGAPFSSFLLDPVGAALAGLAWRDGQDTGGWPWDLQSTMPNVEDNELFYPMLYLWRKELPDSGGAGKFRGGNGAEVRVRPAQDGRASTSSRSPARSRFPGPASSAATRRSTNSFRAGQGRRGRRADRRAPARCRGRSTELERRARLGPGQVLRPARRPRTTSGSSAGRAPAATATRSSATPRWPRRRPAGP